MSNLSRMRADTAWYLAQWGEPLLRRRATASFDAKGQATEDWSASLSFTGDFQALSGDEIEAEAGLEHRSDEQVIVAYNADIQSRDRVYRYDENLGFLALYRVNYTRDHECQKVLMVYKEIQQP